MPSLSLRKRTGIDQNRENGRVFKRFKCLKSYMSLSCEYGSKEKANWPKYYGCSVLERKITLEPGAIIDRFGGNYGYYLGDKKSTYTMRSLNIIKPYLRCEEEYKKKLKKGEIVYREFVILKPLKVKTCKIIHAFGNSGGGVQYRLFEKSIKEHVNPKPDLNNAKIPNIGDLIAYGYIAPIPIHSLPKFR
jgi:hypothetical protein